MKNKKIVIAGGTGFIGQEMIKHFGKENELYILTRQITNGKTNRNNYSSLSKEDLLNTHFIKWDARPDDPRLNYSVGQAAGRGKTSGSWAEELNGADLIINLAGKSVNCRYNKKNKKEIFDSRTHATEAIGEAIRKCKTPPPLWVNASSATIYRHAEDGPQDEYNGEYHDDFSVQVCKRWEKCFYEQTTPLTRKIDLRMAINIGPGGILIPFFNLLKFGLGGKQGNGRQMFSWVHIADTCRMIEWVFDHKELEGTYNCSSPNPLSNEEFMKTLRKVSGHKFGLPAFKWMLQIGAPLIGTETELVFKSRWVIPTKILESGFQFKFPELKEAFEDVIKKVPRRHYHLF